MTGAVDPEAVVRRLETTARERDTQLADLRHRCADRSRPTWAIRHLVADVRHHRNKRAIVRRTVGKALRAPAHTAKRQQLRLAARRA